jgi:aminoglycoside phosphotransferase (APT) family kinase protein
MTDVLDQAGIVDAQRLGAFLDTSLGGTHETTVEKHIAGFSNETFFVYRAGEEYVLRRPPRGPILPTAHDVEREYRFLAALHGTAARVPRPVVLCTDREVIGAPFYLMERKRGHVIREGMLDVFATPEDRRTMSHELVDTLAELHSVDWPSTGLKGKAEGFLDRQMKRWRSQSELTVGKVRELPGLPEITTWLVENQPDEGPSTVVHGDFKLDNVMFAPEAPPHIIAIFDWEMATVGDPLADLGWLLHTWGKPPGWREGDDPLPLTALPGFSTRQELTERYGEKTGRSMSAFTWYHTFALYKMLTILEGLYVHYKEGTASNPAAAEFETRVPRLVEQAHMVIEEG